VFTSPSGILTYHRIQTSALKTVAVRSNETHTIQVPAKKTLKIFPTATDGSIHLTQPPRSQQLVNFGNGCDLDGPLTVTVKGHPDPNYPNPQVVTYCLLDDFLDLSDAQFQGRPAGTSEIVVEKSTDLAQWTPVMLQSTDNSVPKAYYRLRIYK
jgi:hypothetical protein